MHKNNWIQETEVNIIQKREKIIPQQGNQLLEYYLNADHQMGSSLHIQQEYKHPFQWLHKNLQPENTID